MLSGLLDRETSNVVTLNRATGQKKYEEMLQNENGSFFLRSNRTVLGVIAYLARLWTMCRGLSQTISEESYLRGKVSRL